MELERQVQEHEEKLKQHDKEIGRLNDVTLELQKATNDSLIRIEENNKFLRDQNTRQSEQNGEILREIINRNGIDEKNKHELKMLDRSNFWKLALGIGGSAGVIFAFVLEILKLIGGR
ncbi:hypothetical protein [Enterococcus sp. AZ103]|uniref:hypothetical protein n=1 Tax=Enterococcus sp. AZ103 TaxID=2774628 RepID=UPI003F26377F